MQVPGSSELQGGDCGNLHWNKCSPHSEAGGGSEACILRNKSSVPMPRMLGHDPEQIPGLFLSKSGQVVSGGEDPGAMETSGPWAWPIRARPTIAETCSAPAPWRGGMGVQRWGDPQPREGKRTQVAE